IDFDAIHIEGIERISIEDIEQAADMGFRIKLLGVAQRTGHGIEARMSPCLVPADSPLGQLEGASNMIVLEGDSVGQVVLQGAGAGAGPTASAIIGDVCDLARGSARPVFGRPASELAVAKRTEGAAPAAYYLRMQLVDRPGALAKIAAVLGDAGISINRMRQYRHTEATAPVLIVTHEARQEALDTAIADMDGTGVLASAPVAIRIERV
ncbi:MAG: ACT domain-containing protein, partial [Boseongicola sp. SB0664_bin_43]|nr:ACT domain-containing protein [Boseongicola sp. SB0664_bin_43]